MRKPKPIFSLTSHRYQRADGSIWMSTAKPGTNMGPGTKWIKKHWYQFNIYEDSEGLTVSGGDLENPSVKDIDRVIAWYKEVKTYLKSKKPR